MCNSPSLPKPVASYLAAVDATDAEMLIRCFADDAVVHDEGRDHRALDAIRSWNQETRAKYRYTLEPLDSLVSGTIVTLRSRLTGDFSGSPADVDYAFTLAKDKIAALRIE